jgi:hypothetical protein
MTKNSDGKSGLKKVKGGYQPDKMQITPPPPKSGPNIKPQKDK